MNNAMGLSRRAVLAGGIALPMGRVAAQAAGSALRPEDFGARGNGMSDDTAAFQALARRVVERGGGTVSLRPGATYRLGRQVRGQQAADPVYMAETMFSVTGVSGLFIDGNGATLKLNDGLHYGSFDPATGQRFDPPPGKFTNPRYAAEVGSLITVSRSSGVRIRDLVLDGNAGRLVVGGKWNVDIQLHADGLRLLDVADVQVENLVSRNHGLDGVYLRGRTRGAAANGVDSIRFRALRCTGNGRQGMSIVGGSGISIVDSLFADTAQGAIASAPSAGVDIEPNGRDWASALLFQNCEFRNNRGVGLLAAEGASRGITVRGCTFWQGFAAGARSKGSGDAFWLVKPGVTIDACKVHGNVTNLTPDAVVRRSSFDDDALPGYGQSAQRRRYLLAGVAGTFEDCSFAVTAPGPHALAYVTKPATFRRCRMHHAGQALPGTLAAAFFGKAVTLEDVRFTEALRQPGRGGNYIAGNGATLRGRVIVSGPHIRWGGPKGPIGDVAAAKR